MEHSIQAVKQRHENEIMSLDGVMAVGIGLADNGESAIIVTVQEGHKDTAARMPERLEGYRVIIQYSGEIRAQ